MKKREDKFKEVEFLAKKLFVSMYDANAIDLRGKVNYKYTHLSFAKKLLFSKAIKQLTRAYQENPEIIKDWCEEVKKNAV